MPRDSSVPHTPVSLAVTLLAAAAAADAAVVSLAHEELAARGTDWCRLTAENLTAVPPAEWASAAPLDVACVPDTACRGLTPSLLSHVRGASCAGWTGCFSYADAASLSGATAKCLAALQPLAIFFLDAAQVSRIPPAALAGCGSRFLDALSADACTGITPRQAGRLGKACPGLSQVCYTAMSDATKTALPKGCTPHSPHPPLPPPEVVAATAWEGRRRRAVVYPWHGGGAAWAQMQPPTQEVPAGRSLLILLVVMLALSFVGFGVVVRRRKSVVGEGWGGDDGVWTQRQRQRRQTDGGAGGGGATEVVGLSERLAGCKPGYSTFDAKF